MSDQRVGTQSQMIEVGDLVSDRYEISKRLGAGGFAKVYLAHDRVIERDVAIKFLDLRNMHGADALLENVLERFRREAKLAAKIPHRNVVQIYDIGMVGEDVGRPFIVMELLHGFDLEDQLNDHGPMEPQRLLPLFIDCLDALGEAHAMGIVHKDLKPSNLFLSSPGQRSEALRIVDFGIAHIKGVEEEKKDVRESQRVNRLTATGQILGTLQYLTPEYIGQQIVTPALDVYQMTLILIETLSGERVIKTDNPFECLRIHTFGLLEVPEYLMSSSLGSVLSVGHEADHTQRYADAKALADALSEIDPESVPRSPKFEGREVATAKFVDTASKPVLPESPVTDELVMGDTVGLDLASSSEHESHLNPLGPRARLDAVRQEGKLAPAFEPTADPAALAQAARSTAATARGERERKTGAGMTEALPHEHDGIPSSLKVALVLIALGVAGALVTVSLIVTQSNEESPSPVHEAETVATVAPKEPKEPQPLKGPVEPEELVVAPAEVREPAPVLQQREAPGEAKAKAPRRRRPKAPAVEPEPEPEPFQRTVTIVTNAPGARVKEVVRGRSGSVPFAVHFDSEGAQPIVVTITAEGYEPATEAIALPTKDGIRTIELAKKPGPEPKSDPPKKTPKPKPRPKSNPMETL